MARRTKQRGNFSHNGQDYLHWAMDAKTQATIGLRLLCVMPALQKAFAAYHGGGDEGLMSMAAQAVAALRQEDTDYIISQCMAVVDRKDGAGWAPVWNVKLDTSNYDDLEMPDLLACVVVVMKAEFGNFFPVRA